MLTTGPVSSAPPPAPPRAARPGRARAISGIVLRSVARLVVILWLVATVTFVAVRALPGNPVDVWMQDLQRTGITAEEARAQASRLLGINVDEPLWQQYVGYLNNLIHFDLGRSVILLPGAPVTDLLGERVLWTLFSVGPAMVLAFVLGLWLGSAAAYRRGSRIDRVISYGSALTDSIPPILLGIVLTFVLGVGLGIVPIQAMRGGYDSGLTPGFNAPFILSALAHAILPGIVYMFSTVGGWALAMRSSAITVLKDDYVTQARARGLSERTIRTSYVVRNAQLPLVTGFAISLGFIISGSVLIESVFVYPGVGQLLANALARRDYTVMQGVVIITTVTVLIATAIADALYGWLDPRTRDERAA
jgi:peptide/nickel transport system permease protein